MDTPVGRGNPPVSVRFWLRPNRPDLPIETYAQILKEISGGTDTAVVAAAHGMTLQEFALLSQHWGTQVIADPVLAQRFAALMMGGGPMPPATPPPAVPPGGAITI